MRLAGRSLTTAARKTPKLSWQSGPGGGGGAPRLGDGFLAEAAFLLLFLPDLVALLVLPLLLGTFVTRTGMGSYWKGFLSRLGVASVICCA